MNTMTRTIRGILILVVAIVVGTLVLNRTVNGTADSPGASPDVSVTQPVLATTVAPITVAARDPKTVKVLVANGSKVNGAAKRARNCLISTFNVVAPVDSKTKPLPTAIYTQPGFEAEGLKVAAALGTDAIPGPMPASLPVATSAVVDINIVVVVGADLATSIKNLSCAEAPTAQATTTVGV